MIMFLIGLVVLIAGYFTYGRFIEWVFGPDDRQTPAVKSADGVDYVVLPQWKNMLIQLLNIAGVGPVIGVIIGIKFGDIVFVIIPIGCILAGAVHDFLGGMMSIRDNGANLPKLIRTNLGKGYASIFSWFMVLLLLLVVAVFINIPANLIDKTFLPKIPFFWWAVGIIFLYYILATLFPVDKIIGKVYPFFGLMLLIGTGAILVALLFEGFKDPNLLVMSEGFKANMFTPEDNPIIPMLFVTIACGIISGFHATQSPIIARTMKSEYQGRASFYGMMITEGIIAMIWAAGGLAIYNLFPKLMDGDATVALTKITSHFLGPWMGTLTVLAVIILAITSGDTAMRSMRLSLAEMFSVEQKSFISRLQLCIPLIVIVIGLLFWSNLDAKSFRFLWNYFAWGNQVLAASTLMAASSYLVARHKAFWVSLLPGIFMTFVVVTYIFWASPSHKQAYGMGLEINIAYGIAAVISLAFAGYAYWFGLKQRKVLKQVETQSLNEPGRK